MTERQFSKGTVIFREGDMGDCFYRVISGNVGIVAAYGEDNEHLIKDLKPNDYFGEMAVIEAYPRSATAVALSDVNIEEFSTSEMGAFFKENPEKVLEITSYIGKCIRDTTEEYVEIADTIEQLGAGEKKDSLMDKLKKFAGVYSSRKKEEKKLSVEASKKLLGTPGDDIECFSKGTVLFKEGEHSSCMYEVQVGKIGIYVDYGKPSEKRIASVVGGEFFGEMGLIDFCSRNATAVVLEDDTTVEIIDKNNLLDLFRENPPKAEAIVAHLSRKLRQVTVKYLESCHLLYDIYNGDVKDDEIKDKASGHDTFNGVV